MNPGQRSGEAAPKFAPLGLHVGQEMLLSQLRHHIGPPVGIEPTT